MKGHCLGCSSARAVSLTDENFVCASSLLDTRNRFKHSRATGLGETKRGKEKNSNLL